MKALAPITKRLDDLAEVLVVTTDFSQYCHTIYEAAAEIERLEGELAAAKVVILTLTMDHNSGPNYLRGFQMARQWLKQTGEK